MSDNEKRTIDTTAQHRRQIFGCQQRRFGRCGRDQDVDLATLRPPLIERKGASANKVCEFMRAIDRTITHVERSLTPREASARAVRSLVFARSKHKDFAIAENARKFFAQDRWQPIQLRPSRA
jgi:hypothetical protein